MNPETLTIIRAKHHRLCKTIHANGTVVGYDKARIVDLIPHPVPDLAALHRLLTHLQARRDCCIIRGEVIDPNNSKRVRRLLHAKPETGGAATIREAPRRWLALDCDGLPAPADIDLHDLAACGQAAMAALPPAFHGAAMIVAATASHAIKPGLRLRLWFWLDRPLIGAELKRWLHGTPVDSSIFAAAQLIYTAPPLFLGRPDFLPVRLATLVGGRQVAAPPPETLAVPPKPSIAPLQVSILGADAYASTALVNAVCRILGATARHPAIMAGACGLARLVAAGLLAKADMHAVLHRAAKEVGKDDPDEIDAVIAWAEEQSGNAPGVQQNGR